MRERFRAFGLLAIVCLLSFLVLSELDARLNSTRRQFEKSFALQDFRRVLPDFDNDPVLDVVTLVDPSGTKRKFYRASKAGRFVGAIFPVRSDGYRAAVSLLAGVDFNGRISRIVLSEPADAMIFGAPGLSDQWLLQFKNLNASQIKPKETGGTIEAIPGLSMTAVRVTDAIREAVQFFSDYKSKIAR